MAECDFSMVLSQGMIEDIVEEYFNKKKLKQPVDIVESQNTDAGYIFFLKERVKVTPQVEVTVYKGGTSQVAPNTVNRSRNGRFTHKKEVSNG